MNVFHIEVIAYVICKEIFQFDLITSVSSVAKAFEEYLHDAVIPDELIYATLSRIEDIKKSNASPLISLI